MCSATARRQKDLNIKLLAKEHVLVVRGDHFVDALGGSLSKIDHA